jgi:hypothetical protein
MADRPETRMLYGQLMVFVPAAYFTDRAVLSESKQNEIITRTGAVLAAVFIITGIRYDNICYLKALTVQQSFISYCNALIAGIKNTEGYRDEMPVVYINSQFKRDNTVPTLYDDLWTGPYMELNDMINTNSWEGFMKRWCGFAPKRGDNAAFAERAEVLEMPYYPDYGSIKVIDGTLIVRF